MPVISIRIPQLGEGLQEALLVEFIKQPGDTIKRDEAIYVMETDKATTDVESPYDGKLIEWTVETGTVLQIGAEIGKIEVAEGVKEMPTGHGPADSHTPSPAASSTSSSSGVSSSPSTPTRSGEGGVMIPPKTRKYLKEKGLLDVADQIPCSGKKLMPEDVDAYLASGGGNSPSAAPSAPLVSNELFDVVNLPQSQIVLNYRLVRGTQVCVPVTVMSEINWSGLESARKQTRDSGGPTAFAMACWCVVEALKKHDKFRSVLSGDGRALKVFKRVNLGVAVALPGDEMVTAVVKNADQLDPAEFYHQLAKQIEIARNGKDQADESTTLTVSNIGKAGMKIGIPAIVAPAVATLAIGETYALPIPDGSGFKFQPTVMATLCFDHRIANGVGAANFMNEVRNAIENFKV
ncbi:MAG: 2-oxo acid dehydrogenase subunit E2 [Pirellulaceae bacterium]|nr:2-oxo acid dehydrogenase subunit E2 [Pirellulaceae bacterium]